LSSRPLTPLSPSAKTPSISGFPLWLSGPPVLSSHRVLHVVRSVKTLCPVDVTMPNMAHTRAVEVGPDEGSGSRSTCGRNPYSRMGACASFASSDRPIQALSEGAGPLRPAACDRAAGGLRFSPGAFQHDVMMALYAPVSGARPEPNGTSQLSKWSEGLPPDF